MKPIKNLPIIPDGLRLLKHIAFAATLGLFCASGHADGHLATVDLNSEALSAGHFPSQDGWTIAESNRVGFVEVAGYGLDYDVIGGGMIDGGTRAIRLKGAVSPAMNQWLTYSTGAPIAESGPVYFGISFEADSIGISTDPHELFIRMKGWSLYTAVKLYAGIVEIPGGVTATIAPEGTEALAGVTHRLVGEFGTDVDGNITSMKLWLNPDLDAGATPIIDQTLDGSINISEITTLELRSQKAVTVVDDLKFGTTLEDVLPSMPADPGDLVVSLPVDSDSETAGIQVEGGTLFVEVDGSEYVADTVLPIGTEVTFRAVPDSVNSYVLTGWRGHKGPRDAVHPFWDFRDVSLLAIPAEVEESLVVPIMQSLNVSPIFEFGEHRLNLSENGAQLYRIRLTGNNSNQLRTLFDTGESVVLRAIGLREYDVVGWEGDLSALTDSTVTIVAGSGVFVDGLDVQAKSNITTRQYLTLGTTDMIASNENGVEFEGTELGAPGTVPLSIMNTIVAEKAPQGLAGVADFETLIEGGGLLFDPSPANDTPAPALVLARDLDGNFDSANSVLENAVELRLQVGDAQVTVGLGPQAYTEAPGRDNLADASGPGVQSLSESLYYKGMFLGPVGLSGNPSQRTPTSGDVTLSGITSIDFTFDPADKVVMSGIVYLSRGDFQHYNPDDDVRLWAQALYSDGGSSTVVSSNQIEQSNGGADHFFGFDSPAGSYVTAIRVWMQGGNNRAFTNFDDLVVVLEGTENYDIAASSSDESKGTVTGAGSFADGATASITAVPAQGYKLGQWTYADAPEIVIGTDPVLDVSVHGSVGVVASFIPGPPSDFDNLALGALDGQDLWVAPDQAQIVDTGLSHTTGDGTVIEGGAQSLLLNGSPTAKMNNWATRDIEVPTGTTYFRYLFYSEDQGLETDPGELFVRMPGWSVYTAVKYKAGLIELPGGNQAVIDAENGLPTGVVHMLVGRLNVENGLITSIDAWLNPSNADEGTPTLTASYESPAAISSVTGVQIRSQNTRIWVDELVFSENWADVVPRGLGLNLNSEALSAGHFPSQDGWTIASSNRDGFVEVAGYGLDYQVAGGGFIDGGKRALRLIGAPSPAMNQWLTYKADSGAVGNTDLYFGLSFEADSIGTSTDPHELFLRMKGWSLYTAIKLYAGIVEIPGGTTATIAPEGTDALAGVTHRLVGRLGSDDDGNITSITLWLNPDLDAGATPIIDQALDSSINISEITTLELRSQKAVTVVDDLKFGTTLADVLPAMPADPGYLMVTLPEDIDAEAAGIQVDGGTLFVEVDGSPYVAETVLPIGTEVTFRALPDSANSYLLTGWRGHKGPRGSLHPFWDFRDASMLAAPADSEQTLVVPIMNSLNVRPIFEFGEHRLNISENGAQLYRIRLTGNNSNQLRTLFDTGESIDLRAIGLREYDVVGWTGDLSALTASTVTLIAGSGVFDGVLDVEAVSNLTLREYLTLGTAAVIDPKGGVEFVATNLGAAGSVPLAVMNAVVAEKAPQGLAGVADFETLIEGGGLLYDPSLANDTPAPALVLARDGDGNYDAANSVLENAVELRLQIGDALVTVRPGPQGYVEAGGSANLATASGPGAQSLSEAVYYKGEYLTGIGLDGNPSNNRIPTSGDMTLTGLTSWDFAFNPEDKVVMSGMVYLSRANFQHTNEDGNVTLWAQARYSDGSVSALLSSDKLDAPGFGGQGGEFWDHFFGFEAPSGSYITGIHVWNRGGNNRSFTNIDDLVVVLEGDQTYTVTATSSNEADGTVTGGGDFADGSVATLTAAPASGLEFAGWTYAEDPDALIGTDLTLDLNVHGSVNVVGSFAAAGISPMDQSVDVAGGDFEVMVVQPVGAEWTAESLSSWITVKSGATGTGVGKVVYTVDESTDFSERTGALQIAGFTHTVTQAAATSDDFNVVVGGVDQGDGTFLSDWFGLYQPIADTEWVLSEEQGYYYVGEALTPVDMYLWSLALKSWVWTSEAIYPIVYDTTSGRFLYFVELLVEVDNPTGTGQVLKSFIYDYETQSWDGLE